MKYNGKSLALCGLFCALLIISSKIQIPTPVIPFTLQTPIFLLTALFLPNFLATVTIGVYLLLGLIGLPVFAQGGGLYYLLNPTFGYLIGFFIASVIKAIFFKNANSTFKSRVILCLITVFIAHLVGNLYSFLVLKYHLGTQITFLQNFLVNGLIFIPIDFIWAFLCPAFIKNKKARV